MKNEQRQHVEGRHRRGDDADEPEPEVPGSCKRFEDSAGTSEKIRERRKRPKIAGSTISMVWRR